MSSALVGALAGGVLAFIATYVFKQRDERRLGGAAERQLHDELLSAQRVLETTHDKAIQLWTKPGLRVQIGTEQRDRLVARFPHPASWQRIDRAVRGLDILQTWAERKDADDTEPDLEPLTVIKVKMAVGELVEELDGRQRRWLAWQPWLKETNGRRGSLLSWARWFAIASAALVLVGGGAWLLVEELGDSDRLNRKAVEAELREMDPQASVVNCRGDDEAADHWRCVVVRGGCTVAAASPTPCGAPTQENVVEVDGSPETDSVYARVVDESFATPEVSSRRRERRLRAWIGRLGREDPPAPAFAAAGS